MATHYGPYGVTTYIPKRNYRIVRHYLSSKINRRIVKENLTETEAREHCVDIKSSSMTCKDKAGRARTRRVGHWFDSFEETE